MFNIAFSSISSSVIILKFSCFFNKNGSLG
nr:MAG TPA: hypothetical protein [Caudoviricetes sp.]